MAGAESTNIEVPRLRGGQCFFSRLCLVSLLDFTLLQVVHVDVNAIYGSCVSASLGDGAKLCTLSQHSSRHHRCDVSWS
jgi:hypothetical protein